MVVVQCPQCQDDRLYYNGLSRKAVNMLTPPCAGGSREGREDSITVSLRWHDRPYQRPMAPACHQSGALLRIRRFASRAR